MGAIYKCDQKSHSGKNIRSEVSFEVKSFEEVIVECAKDDNSDEKKGSSEESKVTCITLSNKLLRMAISMVEEETQTLPLLYKTMD